MIKYKLSTLFIFILTICTFQFVNAQEPYLFGKIIYIDPGHGGIDPGAIYKEIKESEINLQIAQELKLELEKNGAIVYMTRNGNYDLSNNTTLNHKKNDLSNRAKIINDSICDLYISIHLNSDSSSILYGTQVFYTTKNKENIILAEIIQNKFKENLKTKREIKELKNMYLFDKINRPGILIEAGFISNSNDRTLLKQNSHQKIIAQTITDALIEYYKTKK